jgi:biopolymer transport protein ExbB
MVYPLLFCSVVALTLIGERLLVLLCYPPLRGAHLRSFFASGQISELEDKRGLRAGVKLLWDHSRRNKSYRDEQLSLWLQEERRRLLAHTRWLMLLGTLTPLLGLLGTVLGIIDMFRDVSGSTGPVTPAVLASGMWEAMVTTALGMFVAIPSLAAAYVFMIWADYRTATMGRVLNDCNLWLEDQRAGISGTAQQEAASFCAEVA